MDALRPDGKWLLQLDYLKDQVPYNEEQAVENSGEERQSRRPRPLSGLFQLLVSLSQVLRRQIRVLHQLIDLRRLDGKIIRKRCLKVRDLEQRSLGGSGRVSAGSTAETPSGHVPDLIQGALIESDHVLVLLCK